MSQLESKFQGNYILPSLDLLEPYDMEGRVAADPEELRKIQDTIIDAFAEFGISVARGDITKWPTITRYELYPAKGVRMSKIAALERDIARAVRSERINLLAPIPGKDTVGIEITNSCKVEVTLRELLDSEDWARSQAKIPLALGKDVHGKIILGDLVTMPHCIVAGTTGGGKSVCINSIIASILFKFTPEQVRFILIDPNMIEMQVYNTLPHLVIPVVTDPGKVLLALRWVIGEMEQRYKIFAKTGVRNITTFNTRPVQDHEVNMPQTMPYIVIIMEGFSGVQHIITEEHRIEIARITQIGHGAGIHMVVVAHTPRANVITGIIKANIPTRIAFQVASGLDSRIILDENGAEELQGQGDMLYRPPGTSRMTRAQGVFVTDQEIHRIVEFVASQSASMFEASIHEKLQCDAMSPGKVTEGDEELVQKCIEIMYQEKKASTSLFQRRLRLGYTCAARLIDILEQRGYIGPGEGAKPREILRYVENLEAASSSSPSIEPIRAIQPNFVVCVCEHCGQKIEFDTNELAGRQSVAIHCPTCGVEVILTY